MHGILEYENWNVEEEECYCRDTISNGPRMTLGLYVKGLNNMICREWAWKTGPWAQVSGVVGVSMEAFIWADLAWLAKSSLSVGCGI